MIPIPTDQGPIDSELCARMVSLARFEPVTGLPNRHYFLELLETKLEEAKEKERFLALLFIGFEDLDRFNQTQGAETDERILKKLAEKTVGVLGEEELLAQVDSDKFVVAYDVKHTPDEVEIVAQELLQSYSETISIDSHLFFVSTAIGISLFPTDAGNAKTLYFQAKEMMRQAHYSGPNQYRFARKVFDEPCSFIAMLNRDLPIALEQGEIFFEVQPQYSPALGRFVGAELLARWRHPEEGMISPGVFLPLAEQSGMIRILSMNAVMEASRIYQRLDEVGIGDFSLSINLPPHVIFHPDFLENIRFFMEHYDLTGRRLGFEITENILTTNVNGMAQRLEALRELGIRIEIDDYGTGYTSLQYLANLPVDTLKIDRKFVAGLHRDRRRHAVFKAIVDMAKALEFDVIAEGVEEEQEAAAVAAFGDVLIQGYYFARPMPVDNMVAMLA